MSRSRRHTPICGNAKARSEKWDKQNDHRRCRTRLRVNLAHKDYEAAEVDERVNVWKYNKDGKHWFGGFVDDEYERKLMRK